MQMAIKSLLKSQYCNVYEICLQVTKYFIVCQLVSWLVSQLVGQLVGRFVCLGVSWWVSRTFGLQNQQRLELLLSSVHVRRLLRLLNSHLELRHPPLQQTITPSYLNYLSLKLMEKGHRFFTAPDRYGNQHKKESKEISQSFALCFIMTFINDIQISILGIKARVPMSKTHSPVCLKLMKSLKRLIPLRLQRACRVNVCKNWQFYIRRDQFYQRRLNFTLGCNNISYLR